MEVQKKVHIFDLSKTKNMQTIIDYLVEYNGKLINVSHRNNSEHITEGASSTLVYQGLTETKTTKELSAWIGDTISVVDYYGVIIFKAVVKAKLKRYWDMNKPRGEREVGRRESKNWAVVFTQYKNQK